MKVITKNKRIKVIVNGRETEVYDNLTILQALLQEDIHIPHLCYDIRLERSNGNCGLCLVEVGEGEQKKGCKSMSDAYPGRYGNHHQQPQAKKLP